MMSNDPTKPGNDAQWSNAMLQERHDLLLRDETSSSTRTDDSTSLRNDMTESLTFPWKLHALLEAAANEGFEHIVSWLDNNASFKVHDPALFIKHIMPRFFKRQSKYKSFQRQLNIWQFERLIGPKGSCNGGYFHVFFYRHDTSLFHLMKRSPRSQKTFSLQETSSQNSTVDYEYGHIQNSAEEKRTWQCPSKDSMTTTDPWNPESRDLHPSPALLSPAPHYDVMQVSIHSDHSVTLDAPNPQYPHVVTRGTSTSGMMIPNCGRGEPWEAENDDVLNDSFSLYWSGRQVLPSPETNLDHHVTSHLDDDFEGDEVLSRCISEEGNIKGSSLALSAQEWKYVLVGMHIALNAG